MTAEEWDTHWHRIKEDWVRDGQSDSVAAILADEETAIQFGPRPEGGGVTRVDILLARIERTLAECDTSALPPLTSEPADVGEPAKGAGGVIAVGPLARAELDPPEYLVQLPSRALTEDEVEVLKQRWQEALRSEPVRQLVERTVARLEQERSRLPWWRRWWSR